MYERGAKVVIRFLLERMKEHVMDALDFVDRDGLESAKVHVQKFSSLNRRLASVFEGGAVRYCDSEVDVCSAEEDEEADRPDPDRYDNAGEASSVDPYWCRKCLAKVARKTEKRYNEEEGVTYCYLVCQYCGDSEDAGHLPGDQR